MMAIQSQQFSSLPRSALAEANDLLKLNPASISKPEGKKHFLRN